MPSANCLTKYQKSLAKVILLNTKFGLHLYNLSILTITHYPLIDLCVFTPLLQPGTDAVLENGNLTSATWHGGVKQLDVPLIKKFNTYFLHPCKKNMRDGRPIKWNFDPSIFEYDETFNILQNVKTHLPKYSSNVKVVSL